MNMKWLYSSFKLGMFSLSQGGPNAKTVFSMDFSETGGEQHPHFQKLKSIGYMQIPNSGILLAPFHIKPEKDSWVKKPLQDKLGENLKTIKENLELLKLPVRVSEISVKELANRKQTVVNAVQNAKKPKKMTSLSDISTSFVGENAKGEAVYITDSGERAVMNESGVEWEPSDIDSQPSEIKERFFALVEADNDIKYSEYLKELLAEQVQSNKASQRWSPDDTMQLLINTTYKGDVEEADPNLIIRTVNQLHESVHGSLEKVISEILSRTDVDSNKKLRAANAVHELKPLTLNDNGDPIPLHISPITKHFKQELSSRFNELVSEKENINFIDADRAASNGPMVITYDTTTPALSKIEQFEIDSIRNNAGHNLVAAFDVIDTPPGTETIRRRMFFFDDTLPENTEATPEKLKSFRGLGDLNSIKEQLLKLDKAMPLSIDGMNTHIQTLQATEKKDVPYYPRSKHGTNPTNYVVPIALAKAIGDALDKHIETHGPIGEYVSKKLDLPLKHLETILSKLQFDTIALSIARAENGLEPIVGLGTGTGKTRVLAAMWRYNLVNDFKTLFTTCEKDLISRLHEELELFDSTHLVRPMVIANETEQSAEHGFFKNHLGEKVKSSKKEFERIVQNLEDIPHEVNSILTTYKTLDDKVLDYDKDSSYTIPNKVRTLREWSVKNTTALLADEAHFASGRTSKTGKNFRILKEVTEMSFNSSATWINRLDKMGAFERALPPSFGESVNFGKLALIDPHLAQAAITEALAMDGGYIRAEMPSDGLEVKSVTDDINQESQSEVIDQYSKIKRLLVAIESVKTVAMNRHKERNRDYEEIYETVLKREYKPRAMNFTNRYNSIDEVITSSLRADFIGELAAESINRQEKPFIPFTTTAETYLNYTMKEKEWPAFSDKQIENREHIEWIKKVRSDNPDSNGAYFNIQNIFERLLNDSLNFKKPILVSKDVNEDKKDLVVYSLQEYVEHFSPENIERLNFIIDEIKAEIALSPSLFASPLDAVRDKISELGYTSCENSGRSKSICYDPEHDFYYVKKITNPSKYREVNRIKFQKDEIDAYIGTRCAYTGIDLAAKPKNSDEGSSKRRAIINSTPPLNPELEIQKLGRTNRTGQPQAPLVIFTTGGTVAEERLIAAAQQRLRNLDSITSGDSERNGQEDVVQWFSHIGDEACRRYVENNPESIEMLDIDVNKMPVAGFANHLTQRLSFEPAKVQNEVLEKCDGYYQSVLNDIISSGKKPFGINTLNVNAVESSRIKLSGEQGGGSFEKPSYLSVIAYEHKVAEFSAKDVSNEIKDAKANDTLVDLNGQVRTLSLEMSLQKSLDAYYRRTGNKNLVEEAGNAIDDTLRQTLIRRQKAIDFLRSFTVGNIVSLTPPKQDQSEIGVITSLVKQGDSIVAQVRMPGKEPLKVSLLGIDNHELKDTGTPFLETSPLGKKFDNAETAHQLMRPILTGSVLTSLKFVSDMPTHIRSGAQMCNIVFAESEGQPKRTERALALPTGTSLESVLACEIELTAGEMFNYVRHYLTSSPLLVTHDKGENCSLKASPNELTVQIPKTNPAASKELIEEHLTTRGITENRKIKGAVRLTAHTQKERNELLKFLEKNAGIQFLTKEFGALWKEEHQIMLAEGTSYQDFAKKAKETIAEQYNVETDLLEKLKDAKSNDANVLLEDVIDSAKQSVKSAQPNLQAHQA